MRSRKVISLSPWCLFRLSQASWLPDLNLFSPGWCPFLWTACANRFLPPLCWARGLHFDSSVCSLTSFNIGVRASTLVGSPSAQGDPEHKASVECARAASVDLCTACKLLVMSILCGLFCTHHYSSWSISVS